MKKALSLFLSLILIMGVFFSVPVTVNAASVSDLKFTLNSDGKSYSVAARNESLTGSIVIPSTFSGYPVTSIAEKAFRYCGKLTAVTIPNSVTSIGRWAFGSCENLTSITIPDGVISVGACAFEYCTNLESVTLSNNITSVAGETFYACSNLASIIIPDGVTSIGAYAFEACRSLKSITIPDSVTSIGGDAFDKCSSLSSVYISDIGAWCRIKFSAYTSTPLLHAENFYLNGKLITDVVIPEGITEISARAFSYYGKLKTIVIPDSVNVIGEYAFSDCTGLTSVTIPKNVTKICNYAFARCEKLTYVLLHNQIKSIEVRAFLGCKNLKGTYYTGTIEDWNNIDINEIDNDSIYNNVIINYDSRKPLPPVLTGISNTASGTKITWDKVIGANSYIVYRRTYNAKTKAWGGWSRVADDITATSYVDKTAKSGYYRYTVKAVNEAGNSGYNTSGIKTYFLAVPKSVTTSNTTNTITVKWGKVAGATGYIVYRKTTGGWTRLGTTKGTSFADKTAKAGVTYRYTIKAYYGSYVSAYNTNGYAVRRLTIPTLKSAVSSKTGITFTWNKVTGATGYIVYRKTGSGSWQRLGTVKTNTYLDKTAKKGVTYKYTVRAYYGTSTSYYNTKGLTIKDKY